MGRSEEKSKNAAMAKYLADHGYPHGKRMTTPAPNSGGLAMVNDTGSSKYQRRTKGKSS